MADPIDIIEITEALKGNLESLVNEKHKLRQRAHEIDKKISALHQSLSGLLLYADALDETDPKLAALVKSIGELLFPTSSSSTLTEACRTALRGKRRMSAMEVRKAIEASGFDFSGYTSNPLSSIHTTLRRLKENDEVKEVIIDGTKYYTPIAPKHVPVTVASGRTLAELLGPPPNYGSLMEGLGSINLKGVGGTDILDALNRITAPLSNLEGLSKLIEEKKK